MKTYMRLIVLFLAVLLSVAGIFAVTVFYIGLQNCNGFQGEKLDHQLTIAFQMQSDEVEFPSYGYDTIITLTTRFNGTRFTQSVRPSFLQKPPTFLVDGLSSRTSFVSPMNFRLQVRTWLSPRLKARADPSTAQYHSVA